jgi:multidrug resistance efflux pump
MKLDLSEVNGLSQEDLNQIDAWLEEFGYRKTARLALEKFNRTISVTRSNVCQSCRPQRLTDHPLSRRILNVNTKLQCSNAGGRSATRTGISGRNGSLPANKDNSADQISSNVAELHCLQRRNGQIELEPVLATRLTAPPPVKVEDAQGASRGRQLFFRCVRLFLAAAILCSVALYTTKFLSEATSEQAYINGEITALKSPIAGQVQFGAFAPGQPIPSGSALFTIENTRFGNQEVAAQLNWMAESAERLHAESEEATLRCKQQEEIYRINQRLYEEKIISRLVLLEEETKLEVARTVMTNKQILAAQAKERCEGTRRQLDLQRAAIVKMPFDGVAWAVPAKNGAEVSTHETVVEVIDPKRIWVDAFFHEKHAQKLSVGTSVEIHTLDGKVKCNGTVEWVRAGVGRIPYEGTAAVAPGDYSRRRVAVRVKLDSECTFGSGEFFGVGRNVIVTLPGHE